MLWTVVVILLILWLLGAFGGIGGFGNNAHWLLVVIVIVVIILLLRQNKVTDLLLFLILIASIAEIFTLKMILKVIVQSTNFSVEDASVKAMTEQSQTTGEAVEEAISELPPTKRKT